MDYEEIETLVRMRAKEIAGVKDLVVKFSNRMKKSHALCYWQETPQAIHFNKRFIDLNKNNFQVLDELIIHECVHLIPGYNRHNRKFFTKCRRFGIEPYGYSESYEGIKPFYSTYCTNCKNCKRYYAKPKITKCKLCKGKLKLLNIVIDMEAKVLHFTVDVEGVVEFARERYWFQDAKKHGVNILKCFIGIEPYQITRILEGDATLKEDPLRDNKIYYFEESDEDFKSKLKDFDAYRKKMSDENFMYIAGTKVQKDLIDEYAGHVVKRLRESMRNTKYGVMFDMKDMDELLGLETRRQELHDAILEDAGFDRNDSSMEACEFKNALDDYVNKQAGTILEAPLGEMSEDEIIEKRKQSEGIMNYMERMNLNLAKQRGLI